MQVSLSFVLHQKNLLSSIRIITSSLNCRWSVQKQQLIITMQTFSSTPTVVASVLPAENNKDYLFFKISYLCYQIGNLQPFSMNRKTHWRMNNFSIVLKWRATDKWHITRGLCYRSIHYLHSQCSYTLICICYVRLISHTSMLKHISSMLPESSIKASHMPSYCLSHLFTKNVDLFMGKVC